MIGIVWGNNFFDAEDKLKEIKARYLNSNINISLESRIELVRSSMQIVKDNNKYLKKLKK